MRCGPAPPTNLRAVLMFSGSLPSRIGMTLQSRHAVERPQGSEISPIPSYQPIHSPADFRVVKLDDLNLLDEISKYNVVERRAIHHKRTGIVVRHIEKVVGTRRIYRARVVGIQDPMTAARMAKAQKYDRGIAKRKNAHNFGRWFCFSFFGLTCSAGLKVVIYHDEMMTISQFEKLHAKSDLASRYFKHEISRHFYAANAYWEETTGENFFSLPGTAWIRLSTGKLCMDVGNGDQ
ncbi:hypothetical protein B0H13DRAFT_2264041, partial [Mycena leptocephala]